MDYWTLVQMLMNQITPEIRKLVLEKLTEMNNHLIIKPSVHSQSDLSRSSVLNSRKKDVLEIQHPSLDFLNTTASIPIPLNMPINANNQFTMNSYPNQMASINMYSLNQTNEIAPSANNYKNNYDIDSQIDLDDIVNEDHEQSDSLDEKLARIKKLYTKIINDKRRRRREREQ
jgi:hypothetical protein